MRGTNSKADRGWNEAEKSRPAEGTSRVPIECTYLISSFWLRRGVMWCEEPNQKTRKNNQKKTFFWGREGVKWGWKVETRKRRVKGPHWMCIPNFNCLAQFKRGDWGGTALFKIKKGEIPTSPVLIDLGGLIVWYVIQLIIFFKSLKLHKKNPNILFSLVT